MPRPRQEELQHACEPLDLTARAPSDDVFGTLRCRFYKHRAGFRRYRTARPQAHGYWTNLFVLFFGFGVAHRLLVKVMLVTPFSETPLGTLMC